MELWWRSMLPFSALTCHYVAHRSSLAPGAAPALAVEGACLAASFLGARAATADAAVMTRLMGLLTAPLASWEAPQEVGV